MTESTANGTTSTGIAVRDPSRSTTDFPFVDDDHDPLRSVRDNLLTHQGPAQSLDEFESVRRHPPSSPSTVTSMRGWAAEGRQRYAAVLRPADPEASDVGMPVDAKAALHAMRKFANEQCTAVEPGTEANGYHVVADFVECRDCRLALQVVDHDSAQKIVDLDQVIFGFDQQLEPALGQGFEIAHCVGYNQCLVKRGVQLPQGIEGQRAFGQWTGEIAGNIDLYFRTFDKFVGVDRQRLPTRTESVFWPLLI